MQGPVARLDVDLGHVDELVYEALAAKHGGSTGDKPQLILGARFSLLVEVPLVWTPTIRAGTSSPAKINEAHRYGLFRRLVDAERVDTLEAEDLIARWERETEATGRERG